VAKILNPVEMARTTKKQHQGMGLLIRWSE
jgi:hypothetical protein